MPTPIVFEDVAPVVPARDLQAALERYCQLGFEVRAYGHGTGYGYFSGEPYQFADSSRILVERVQSKVGAFLRFRRATL